MAYNVHGLGNKYLHPEFYDFLEQFDIFILLETHVEEKNLVNYGNKFKNFNTYWKPASRTNNRGRGIGGQVCGVKKDLREAGFKHTLVHRRSYDIIYCELNTIKFELIPIYLRGVKWMEDFNEMNKVVEDNDFKKIIIGDHNIRIGEEQLLPEEIGEEFRVLNTGRKSNDKILNAHGKKYIEFCNNNGLVILNGRTFGDEEGCFTFTNGNGSSVIDLCAVSLDIINNVQSFEVKPQLWSDHLPIVITLRVNSDLETGIEKLKLLPKLKWKQQNKENYQKQLNDELSSLENNPSLSDFTRLIMRAYPAPSIIRKPEYHNRWFDKECMKARDKTMKLLNKFRSSKNSSDREAYVSQKNLYQKLCGKKRLDYYRSIEIRLDFISDSKSWWSLAKEIRQKENCIGCAIATGALKTYFETLLNPKVNSQEILYAPNQVLNEMLDRDFTLPELQCQLKKVQENKAPGDDRIPYEFFIHATDEFLNELCKTFTRIFNGYDDFSNFKSSIIFPIHKKGDPNIPSNYRGITFMNCIGKLMIGMINTRITEWTNEYCILNEFQAGFRKGYSTIDNVFNLKSIVDLKRLESRKVYAFFVDFKAAFDRVPRNQLIYKLYEMGLSTKIVNFIEKLYTYTKTAVWNGKELSDHFITKTGVKQGCLLSPLLFSIYLNDLHESLGGGLSIDEIDIRLLMYADDIVILADDPLILQRMIDNLSFYCKRWGMEVNQAKSEIMIFRNSGRLAANEKWIFNGEHLRVTNEYKYLGITLTPKLSFNKHAMEKNEAAKSCLNSTWANFIGKPKISLKAKWKMFLSVCRSIQSYGAQIWGNGYFDEVDKLYRFFIKRILKLPENTPNYIIALETGYEPGYIYTYSLHLKYLAKVLFDLENHRLPHILAVKIMQNNTSWYKDFKDRLQCYGIEHQNVNTDKIYWYEACQLLTCELQNSNYLHHNQKSQESESRIYKLLDPTVGSSYCNDKFSQIQISYIMRARAGAMGLNGVSYREEQARMCSICNLGEIETTQHFIGVCPIFSRIRSKNFKKSILSDTEIISVLNGGEDNCWIRLFNFLREAMNYRRTLINEFNY